MKLKAGTWYKQRNGGKAYVVAVDETKASTHVAVGWGPDGWCQSWARDGRYFVSSECCYDLIAEWVDERVSVHSPLTDAELALYDEKRQTVLSRDMKVDGEFVAAMRERLRLREVPAQPEPKRKVTMWVNGHRSQKEACHREFPHAYKITVEVDDD